MVVEPYASSTGDVPPQATLYRGSSGGNEHAIAECVGIVRQPAADSLDASSLAIANGVAPGTTPAQAYEMVRKLPFIDVALLPELRYWTPTP